MHYKRLAVVACAIGISHPPTFAAEREFTMMPIPAHVEAGQGALRIDRGFTVGVCGTRSPFVSQAVGRFVKHLTTETGLILPTAISGAECSKATLVVAASRTIAIPELGDDETYTLEVTTQSAQLSAPNSTGILRGLATFQQLIQPDSASFAVPVIKVEDRPRFPWRGLMLDVSRHWMPLPVIERNLDAMAAVKLNVFHWHLADDQGFRVESHVFPKLQELGSDGNFYTQEQVRHVVRYAADRGIRVVPEFDIPGHTTAWLVGYPELGSAPGPYEIGRKWGVYEATLDPTREATYHFLDRFIAEMVTLFPDPYFHIGGDEIDPKQWNANKAIQSFIRTHGIATPEKLHEYFNRRLEAILVRHGRKMIGWDEILTPDLPKTAIIQSWRGQDSLAAAARLGHRGLLSSGYYLDQMKPASYHYLNDPLSGDSKVLTPEQAALILGGEACMWTEYVDEETVDSRIWPRLAAIAERFWSPAETTDIDSMYARLEVVSRKLQWTGLEHRSAQAKLVDRIANFRPAPALGELVSLLEAAGIHERYPAHTYNSLEPLNRLVDAATAESESARRLTADARAIVSASGDAQASSKLAASNLETAFDRWRQMPEQIAPIAMQSFLASEIMPVAEALARLGETGHQALGYMQRRETPPTDWINAQQTLLETCSKRIAEVHVAPVEVIRVLLASFSNSAKP